MSHFTPPTTEELQALIPNYQVESILAQGEKSAVYAGTHMTLGRKVAIKILPQDLSQNEVFKTAFEKSAKALASVQHPNIAGVYDFGNVNGMLYTILEYVSGRSLFDISYGQKIEALQAAGLISAMAKGLHKAHQSGILHLDVKPTNVLIDDAGNGKLVDFRGTLPTADEVTVYTSPESVSRPELVDQRADVFSLGVILYELLTSQLPAEHLVPASSLTQVDPGFDHIIAKAIHPNPDMRYLTAEEIGNELDQLIVTIQQPAAPQNPFNTGPVRLATGPAVPQLGAARPVLTAPVAINAPAATGPVGVTPQGHNPLAVVAGRSATVTGARPLGAGGLGATSARRPIVNSSSGGGGTVIWVVLGLMVVVGVVLALAMKEGDDNSTAEKAEKAKKELAAQKAKDRDKREEERLEKFKRDKAQALTDNKEDKEIAKEEKMEAKEAAMKKKFIGAWQYKKDGATWRSMIKPNGNLALMKDGKDTQQWAGYTWAIDGDIVKIYKSDGSYHGSAKLLANRQINIDGVVAKYRKLGAKWDDKDDSTMADNDKNIKTGKPLDVIAKIMAEEDVPVINMGLSNLPEAKFDVKKFIQEEREKISTKIDEALQSKTQRIGPLTRKLEREMTESIVNWDKGDDGRNTLRAVKLWLAECESKSTMLPLPSDLTDKAKEVLNKDLKANKFITDDLDMRPYYDLEDLKDEYSNSMNRKAYELRQKDDRGATAQLDLEEMNTTRSTKAFIQAVWEKAPK